MRLNDFSSQSQTSSLQLPIFLIYQMLYVTKSAHVLPEILRNKPIKIMKIAFSLSPILIPIIVLNQIQICVLHLSKTMVKRPQEFEKKLHVFIMVHQTLNFTLYCPYFLDIFPPMKLWSIDHSFLIFSPYPDHRWTIYICSVLGFYLHLEAYL